MSKTIRILAICGVSGTGKTEIAKGLSQLNDPSVKRFIKLKQSTTRPMRDDETHDDYNFIDDKQSFLKGNTEHLTALTIINGHWYGTEINAEYLDRQYDLDETIFIVVVNTEGYFSLMELNDRLDYDYQLRTIRVQPPNNLTFATRDGRDESHLERESTELDKVKDAYRLVNVISDRDGDYVFKTPLQIAQEMRGIDDEWERFISSKPS